MGFQLRPGGNWGVTSSLNASSLAAPFAVRCADANALHPLQLRRRSKWYLRTGRNKEDGRDLGCSKIPNGSSKLKERMDR